MVTTNGIELHVTSVGAGSPVMLLHGWPHTHRLWDLVAPALAHRHRVISPDLRGSGASAKTASGYDGATLAADLVGLLDALGEPRADVVAIDAGVAPALLLALCHPTRVRRLVVMEALAGTLSGAESLLAKGPPWWFGFHGIPGLPETVLEGHESEYIDWFLRAGTHDGNGVPPAQRDAFVAAHTGRDALRASFGTYRAMPETAKQIAAARRLTAPTLAIGANTVGDALARQLAPKSDNLTAHTIPHCGHIVPLDRPIELLAVLRPFLASADG